MNRTPTGWQPIETLTILFGSCRRRQRHILVTDGEVCDVVVFHPLKGGFVELSEGRKIVNIKEWLDIPPRPEHEGETWFEIAAFTEAFERWKANR